MADNKKYKIALYKFEDTSNLESILSNVECFEIVNLNFLNEEVFKLVPFPDILLTDINTSISEEMKIYLEENFIQLVKITELPMTVMTENNTVLSISKQVVKYNSLGLKSKNNKTYIEYTIEFLKKIAQQKRGKKNEYIDKMFNKDLKRYFMALLMKIIYLIDSKDNYTKKHSENVSYYATMLGRELGLSKKELELLEIGGMLHDVGKIGIPDYLLIKNTKITNEEFEVIKRHVLIGEVLLPVDAYKEIKEILRSHHERIDGSGYPDGLKGDEIKEYVKIISIADTFDAMTTHRSYNRIKTLDEAINELYNVSTPKFNQQNEIVQQLDTDLVKKFVRAIRKDTKLIEYFEKQDKEIIKERNERQLLKINGKKF